MSYKDENPKEVAERMRAFSDLLSKVYNEAEVLRDCTADHDEKEIFNQTRNVLYNLVRPAMNQAAKWEREAGI